MLGTDLITVGTVAMTAYQYEAAHYLATGLEWLLQGALVQQVVPASDGTAALLAVLDPRWYALHKLWLADKPGRSALKAPRDRKQGEALLEAIAHAMPRFPLDDAFIGALPAELRKYLPAVEKAIEKTRKTVA